MGKRFVSTSQRHIKYCFHMRSKDTLLIKETLLRTSTTRRFTISLVSRKLDTFRVEPWYHDVSGSPSWLFKSVELFYFSGGRSSTDFIGLLILGSCTSSHDHSSYNTFDDLQEVSTYTIRIPLPSPLPNGASLWTSKSTRETNLSTGSDLNTLDPFWSVRRD